MSTPNRRDSLQGDAATEVCDVNDVSALFLEALQNETARLVSLQLEAQEALNAAEAEAEARKAELEVAQAKEASRVAREKLETLREEARVLEIAAKAAVDELERHQATEVGGTGLQAQASPPPETSSHFRSNRIAPNRIAPSGDIAGGVNPQPAVAPNPTVATESLTVVRTSGNFFSRFFRGCCG